MAARTQPIRLAPVKAWPGGIAAGIVAALILGTLAAVAWRAETASGLGPGTGDATWAALRFTILQASLSALISVALAIPVARALARRRFAGRRLLIALLGVPFILPVIVAVLGLLAVFGRAGWLSDVLGLFGLPPVQVYGLHGVVLAHVFLNLPLATRLLLQGWQEVPAERFRLAAQLGVDGWAMVRLIEAPMLARVVPGALAVVFALCLTSFAVALILGGGPRATTLELAIFQAFRFEFDLGRAALLSALQILIATVAGLAALRLATGTGFGTGLDRALQRWDGQGTSARLGDGAAIALAAAFLILPLAAIATSGLATLPGLPVAVWQAALVSILVALVSTALLLAIALPIAITAALRHLAWVEVAGLLGLAASPLVIGTGLFILINPVADPFALALPVTALVNAVMALPFALRILVPRARDIVGQEGRLALSLGMGPLGFTRLVILPRMRAQLGFAAGLAAALSMGDLGVIALFADPDTATLPLQIYRLMGAYRSEDAAGAALLLLILSVGTFWLLDRGGRGHAEA
jgi:thiamine transport system permease protein